MNFIKDKKNLLIIILFIIFFIFNNFFYNFYFLTKNSYFKRMNYHYGYCHHSGYGFVSHILTKYNLENNIRIINYIQKPNSEWFFYKLYIPYYDDRLILLNALEIKNIDKDIIDVHHKNHSLGRYKILEKYENCFYLKKVK